jgi:hypothetical protein
MIMVPRNTILFLLAVLLFTASVRASAQNLEADQQAYCAYLAEQSKSQTDFLRSPTALAGFTQPETGLPTQFVAGASLSLSNLKKAGLTEDVARKNCELYKASTRVQATLLYALSSFEKDALAHRLKLIAAASQSLDVLIDKTTKMVDAQNMTRPMLFNLLSSRIKLESDRADTESKIAAIYISPLADQPLKSQVAAKQASDANAEKSLAKLTRQNNWDVSLSVGTHQQINPFADGLEPYGAVSVTYNLGSRAIDRHLDRTTDAYVNWKKTEEGNVTRGMEILHGQAQQSLAVQQRKLQSIEKEIAEMDKNLQLVSDAETTPALDFRNQLDSTRLLLGVESGDATYRIQYLQEFISKNF